jgi:hypothetical protein
MATGSSREPVTALVAGSAWLAPSLRRPRSAPLFHRCMVFIEMCGKAHARESWRRGQRGRAGGQGWLGWPWRAGLAGLARAVGGVLLLLRVLRHRRWAASSTVAYAADALCVRARARECASVLRQACVCPRLAAMFKTKCARERRVAEYVFVTDCRNHQPSLYFFIGC